MILGRLLKGEKQQRDNDAIGRINAIERAMAVITFDLDGNVLSANDNFLQAMGYTLPEIVGKHHRQFVDPAEAASPAYAAFWKDLSNGLYKAAEFKRIAKGGKTVWIQASYNPILDEEGKPIRVVKFATDITAQKLRAADAAGKIAAVSRSNAVIEFTLDGEILTANENFLNAMGYRLDEIKGKHHRIFVKPDYAASADYQAFWAALGRGEFFSDEYERVAKGGKSVWIQATYNPILDAEGKPEKVVKFATDVTQRKAAMATFASSLQRLAQGDLRTTIDTEYTGELEELRLAFNRSLTQLRSLVGELTRATSEVENAAAEISAGGRTTSRGGPSRRHPASRRPRPRPKRWRRPCARTPRTPRAPTSSPTRPTAPPARAARSPSRRSAP
jgi:methyl-accepting chemotaxis protein